MTAPVPVKSGPFADDDEEELRNVEAAIDAAQRQADAQASEENDSGDRVVQEIDVYLSPELASQIHLMQYPLQQEERSAPVAARIKPRHNMIELDFEVPSNADGGFGQFHMNTRTYQSHTIPVPTHMMLGKMVRDSSVAPEGLHLVPLSHITQMRPSFAHVDEATSNATATTDDDIARQKNTAALEHKPLAFTKKESEKAMLRKKSSYPYKKASENAEPWTALDVYLDSSTTSKAFCTEPQQRLLADSNKNDPNARSEPPSNRTYVQSLNYLPRQIDHKVDESSNPNSMDQIAAKLVRLMQRGYPIPYTLLRNQFPFGVSDDRILTALESCAFCVRGNFVIQSRLLPISPALVRSRTFILYVLQTMEILHRPRLERVFADVEEMNDEATRMLLEQVARRTTNGWKLKVDDDIEFATNNYSKLVTHLGFWRNQDRRFEREIALYKAG